MATKNHVRMWLERSKARGATHMLVVCDTFSYEDYPVDVMPGESARAKRDEYNKMNMQRVIECYSHALSHEVQLEEHRANHWD